MRRNVYGLTLCAMLFALCSFASAQQPKKVPRIGYLSNVESTPDFTRAEAIRLALRERGYVDGQDIAFEYRYAEVRKIASLTLQPSWCGSRSISSWQLDRILRSERR
jgi:hypothetical protein